MNKNTKYNKHKARKKNPPGLIKNPYPKGWIFYSLLAIVVLISFVSYLPILHHSSFVWDDEGYIRNNLLVKTFSLKEIFSQNVMGNYHPFTILALAIEYHYFGLNATGYHNVNLFLHLLNVLLVFQTVLLLSNKQGVALVAALLFGIHPVHVESVAWASGLKDLLCSSFFLASFIFYLKYIKSLHKKFYLLSVLLFFLSLLSKAVAASLPVLLLLTDYYKERKIKRIALLDKAPFFFLSFIFGIIAVIAQKTSGNISNLEFPFIQRLAFACYGFSTYLIRLVLPLNLSSFYPYPVKTPDLFPITYYAYVLIVIGIAVTVFYSLRFTPKLLFGLGFFTITVFFMLQLLPVGKAIMADRYSYIPSIGIFFLAGEGFCLLWGKKLKLMSIIILSTFAIFLSVKTYSRSGIWDNELTLWNDVISKYPSVPTAYLNRGIAFGKENKYDRAIKDFSKAIELDPNFAKAHYNRGNILMIMLKYDLAKKDYDRAIELDPNYTAAYYNRGSILADLQDFEKALADYSKVIELSPNQEKAYINRGYVFSILKKYESASKDFERAIELNPFSAEAYYNLGILFMNMQENNRAIEAFNKTIELNPNDTEAYINRGHVLSSEKRYNEAILNYSKLINIKPDDGRAFFYRGLAEYYSGEHDAALYDIKQATSLGYKPAADFLSKLSRSE